MEEKEAELADPRVAKAADEENKGLIFNRIRSIALRAWEARSWAAEKETPRCDYRFCRLQKGHTGGHREVDSGRDD